MTAEEQTKRIDDLLLAIADNVAKHVIQRSGWEKNDCCFQVDLRKASGEILDMVREAKATMRERCAKAIEGFKTDNPTQGTSYWGEALASAIRTLE